MQDEDRPPEHIWLNDEAVNEHFERLKARYAKPGSAGDEVVPMDQNEFTRDLKKG